MLLYNPVFNYNNVKYYEIKVKCVKDAYNQRLILSKNLEKVYLRFHLNWNL